MLSATDEYKHIAPNSFLLLISNDNKDVDGYIISIVFNVIHVIHKI